MTITREEAPPIMCTLAAGDYKDRMTWIADLNRGALRGKNRQDLRLELTYAPEAVERVREMVRREQACCSFLTFGIREDADAVRLTIAAPEEAREAAELLFEPFQSTSPSETACGCAEIRPALSGSANDNACIASRAGALPDRSSNRRAVGIAATASCGALACAACCVLPVALPAVMLTTASGLIVWLAGASGWIAWLAVIAVAGSWIWVWRQSARTRARPANSTLWAMGMATAALAMAFWWPRFEPTVLRIVM